MPNTALYAEIDRLRDEVHALRLDIEQLRDASLETDRGLGEVLAMLIDKVGDMRGRSLYGEVQAILRETLAGMGE